MDEVPNQGVEVEIAPPETEARQDVVSEAPVEDKQERNWRELRRTKDELERKVRMQDEMMQTLLNQRQQIPQAPPPAPEPDLISQLRNREYVEGKEIADVIEKQDAKWTQRVRQIEEKYEQNTKVSLFNDLKTRYPDFSDHVNSETLAILETEEPELAQTIADSKDPYKIAVQSYKYIKALGIAEKVPGARRAREVEQKLEQNKKTAPSSLSSDKRPMVQAFALPQTKEEKAKIYNEMMGYASLSGGSY